MPCVVHLLGQVRIEDEAGVHRPPLDKRVGLLAYLACAPGWVGRDRLAFLFWADAPNGRARTNLRSLLARLRSLPCADELEIEPDRARWRGASDVRAFREAVEAEAWARAVEVYGGQLLPGSRLDEVGELGRWLQEEREALRDAYRRALLTWCDRGAPAEDAAAAAARLEALLSDDPYDEEVARRAIALRAADGDRPRALRLARELRRRLAEELDATPSEETERLLRRIEERGDIGDDEAAEAVSARSEAASAHLPASLTPFVARERERHELAERLVRADCRLLTVTGIGGVGKTRLALCVAADLAHGYRDGARFVPLAAARSVQDVAVGIAQALEVSLAGDEDAERTLPSALVERRALLVLDDLDGRLGAVSFLADLLTRCPGVDLLVTARERLDASEEWLYPLAGMARPAPAADAETARRSDAVRLFTDAAERVEPSFRLQDEDVAHATRICRLVEGLPLGLELAAAWVRALPVMELAAELEGNLDLLRRAPRGSGDRHRSVRAALEHSWTRLPPEEATVFATLSVFRGGFRRDAAAHVAGVGVAGLAALVDRSLLRLSSDGRYDFHPLVAHYAATRLAERPNAAREARLRHRRHYAKWIEEAAEEFEQRSGAASVGWRATEEYANLIAALEGALEDGDAEVAAGIAHELGWFWLWRGRLREGHALAERVLALDLPPASVARAQAFSLRGQFALATGALEQSLAAMQEAYAIAREVGEGLLTIEALNNLAFVAMRTGRHEEARSYFEQGLRLAVADEHVGVRAALLVNLGALAVRCGDEPLARASLNETIALAESVGNVKKAGLALLYLGRLERQCGDRKAAMLRLRESFAALARSEHADFVARAHLHMAMYARAEGDHGAARARVREALTVWWDSGTVGRIPDALRVAAAVHADAGASEEAERLWARAEREQPAVTSMLFPSEIDDLQRAVNGRRAARANQTDRPASPSAAASPGPAQTRGARESADLAAEVASLRESLRVEEADQVTTWEG